MPFTITAADYDNDGDQDLYVANDYGRNNLYRNDNGHFSDVAHVAGVEDISAGMSVSWGDYNHDGHMDLYVSLAMLLRRQGRRAESVAVLEQAIKMFPKSEKLRVELTKLRGDGHSFAE